MEQGPYVITTALTSSSLYTSCVSACPTYTSGRPCCLNVCTPLMQRTTVYCGLRAQMRPRLPLPPIHRQVEVNAAVYANGVSGSRETFGANVAILQIQPTQCAGSGSVR